MTGVIDPRESDIVSFDWTIPMDFEIESARVMPAMRTCTAAHFTTARPSHR